MTACPRAPGYDRPGHMAPHPGILKPQSCVGSGLFQLLLNICASFQKPSRGLSIPFYSPVIHYEWNAFCEMGQAPMKGQGQAPGQRVGGRGSVPHS